MSSRERDASPRPWDFESAVANGGQYVILQDGRIRGYSRGAIAAEIPLADVKVIGEYTTTAGPDSSDYFVTFVVNSGRFLSLPYECPGVIKLMEDAGKALNADLTTRLAHSTVFASRIMWPEALRERPLVALSDEPDRKFFRRLLDRFLGRKLIVLSDETKAAVAAGATEHGRR